MARKKSEVYAGNVVAEPGAHAVLEPVLTAADLQAANGGVPVLGKDDKLAIMESVLAMARFETQFRQVVETAKRREQQLGIQLEQAFKNSGADPNQWVLNKETFLFEKKTMQERQQSEEAQ